MRKHPPSRTKARTTDRVSLRDTLRWLERQGTEKQIEELGRYGITASRPYGVTVGQLKKHAKEIGTDHELALRLWETGRYEARLLASFVDDPERVTAKQMDAWASDFDNWAIVDTVCFHLFDRTTHAWKKVPQWAKAKAEFKKRAAFALIWSLSVHDKNAPDRTFVQCLPLIERAARDERDLVKKAVDMSLRAVGKRNQPLNAAAVRTAERLAESEHAPARWVGRHALRELTGPAVRRRLSSKR